MVYNISDENYKQCTISLLDNIMDPNITFDDKGVCNYYHLYKLQEALQPSPVKRKIELEKIVKKLKKNGKGKPYDCMIGVSGGVDSSYMCYLAWKLGLRVLCVHFDNGWNSELAVDNIHKIISKCNFDLYTYVINWEEFKDIQLSYFKAGVIDIEAVTDIGIFNALDLICSEKKINYILDGRNFVTESIGINYWGNKNPNNLMDIHRLFGKIPLNEYPAKFKRGKYVFPNGMYRNIRLLDYVDYEVKTTKDILKTEFEWRDYGGKHYESVFTRFYQGYILPEKFKVDKRKLHLSNLIFSGQMTKEEALIELSKPIYPDEYFKKDKEFVLKKLGFSEIDFEEYMKAPNKQHNVYFNEYPKRSYTINRIFNILLFKIKENLF